MPLAQLDFEVMSIALERTSGIGGGMRGSAGYIPIYNPAPSPVPEFTVSGGDRLLEEVVTGDHDDRRRTLSSSSSSTSSIGRNSDEMRSGGEDDGEEVQSQFRGAPTPAAATALDSLEALEEVLPVKRSISKFYAGKSKSFTSLSDAETCSSVKEIVKPENAYTRKRKNLLAHSIFWDKNSTNIHRSSSSGGLLKRPANTRNSLAIAATLNSTESANNSEGSNTSSSSPSLRLPPLPPHARRPTTSDSASSSSPPELKFSPWRSLSLSDLQGATTTGTTTGSTDSLTNSDKGD